MSGPRRSSGPRWGRRLFPHWSDWAQLLAFAGIVYCVGVGAGWWTLPDALTTWAR